MTTRSTAKTLLRIASLVVPSWIAWYVAFGQRASGELAYVVTYVLGPLWVLVAGGLVLRIGVFLVRRLPLLERIDILTARGSALSWMSAGAVVVAVWTGYASIAVVGLLGTALFHIVVVLSFIALRAPDPIGIGTIARTFTPLVATEGGSLVERICFAGTRVPIGFRLFATGRIGSRWATSRHVISSEESSGDVLVESDVGPAVRGEHQPDPLVVWLEDTFGLCRSPVVRVAAPEIIVVPRSQTIEGVQRLRDHGFAAKAVRTTTRLPTDGVFDLRTYHPGDDVRRIHWVRSAVAGELVVRMPDELPPDRPRMCLVLDTYVPKAFALDCDAPSEVLDGLVAVWLAVGRALCASGARVTLVTVLPGSAAIIRHVLSPHAFYDSQRLGARVGWQHQVPVERLLTSEATYVVARGLLAEPPQDVPHARWIVAVPAVSDPNVSQFSALRHLFPFGSTEIRWSHRRRVLSELLRRRIDHARAMRTFGTLSARPPAGSFAAYRGADGVLHLGELGAAS